MLFTLVVKSIGNMSQFTDENFNLLNRIHDGVIVLGEHDNCLKFANEPAVAIFKQLPERDLFDISTIVQQEEEPS